MNEAFDHNKYQKYQMAKALLAEEYGLVAVPIDEYHDLRAEIDKLEALRAEREDLRAQLTKTRQRYNKLVQLIEYLSSRIVQLQAACRAALEEDSGLMCADKLRSAISNQDPAP